MAEPVDVDTLAMQRVDMAFGPAQVLQGVELRVGSGEIVGLSGPNGAGKSTLLRLSAGLLRPGRGRVEVLGLAADRARRRGWIGWTPAGEASFTRRLSLRHNLETGARLAGLRGATARRRLDQLAEQLELREHLDAPAECCSSGLRQRATLARALIHGPRLLLLDEPLRSVDSETRLRLAERLREAARNSAVLWVSHEPDELARVADRVLRLDAGGLLGRGPVASGR